MAGKIKGITIEFDGDVSRLQKSLKSVDTATKKINTELGKLDNALKFNPGNTELLAQKYRRLSEKVDETKKKLEALKEVDKNAKKQLESGDLGQAEYDKLQREIIETESQLKNFSNQVKQLDNYKLTKLGNQFTAVGEKLKGVGDKLQNWGSKLTAKVTVPIVAVGGAGFKMAADLEDAMGATDQIFKDSSDEMKRWADNIDSYYGIAEGEALGYANTMGAMLQNIGGLSEKEAAKQSQTLTQLAGDLSAMFGGTTESAVQALTNALKGNNSMLDNYGMGVNDATVKQKAFEMGIYSGKGALGLQEKQAATLALIMEQTADAQGQAGREAEGASGSMKTLATEVKGLATDIGEVLLPIVTPLVQKLSGWVEKFKELDKPTQELIVKIGLITAAVGPMLVVFGKIIGVVGGVVGAFGKLIPFVASNPIVLIIAGIVGAAALLIKNWDWVKAKAIQLGSSISQTWQNIKTATTNIWNGIKGTISGVWSGIKSGVSNSINSVKNTVTNIFGGLKSTVSNIWNGIKNAITTPINKAKEIVRNAINTIKGLFNFKFKWPKLKMPHFKISGSINPLSKNFPPKIGVDWYAQGGIFDSPSVIGVGEAGQEAVLPTHKLDKFLEEAVSRVSGQGQGSGITINIENAVVREESDIRRIAEEVNRLFEVKKNRLRSAGGIA